jgi:hypothetical protein
MRKSENVIVARALKALGEDTDELRQVVADLVEIGFNDVDELVEFAQVARETGIVERHDDYRPPDPIGR